MASEKKERDGGREDALLRGGLRGRMAGSFCTLQSSVDALQRYLSANTTPEVYHTARAMLEEMTRRIAALERISGNAAELACGALTHGAGELAPLELSEYLAESVACINEELALRGFPAKVNVQHGGEKFWVMATTGLVDGIVVNLLSNLLQACPEGTMALELGPGRTLIYRDNGPGLDPEEAEALLEQGRPPLRLRENGAVGLLLVREYALAMGWAVHVGREAGLCIRFDLPGFEMPPGSVQLQDTAAENRNRAGLFAARLSRELDGVFGPALQKNGNL